MRRLLPLLLLGLAMALAAAIADARVINGCTIAPGTVCIGTSLQGASLRGAQLHNATLRMSSLRRAVLQRANLRNADLRKTDLRNADLRNADLRNADLRHADLRNANLRSARLKGARLSGARLAGANLVGTILAGRPATPSGGAPPATAAPTGPGNASTLPDPTSLILPYATAADLDRIGPKVTAAYAQAHPSSTPPFVFHNGIDFITNRDLVPFRSMTEATVTAVEVLANGPNEQVSVRVDAGGGYTIVYGFEPMAPSTGQQQLAQIDVRLGDHLQPGSSLGRLVKVGSAAHLHVHMQPSSSNDAICFADRWSSSDQAAATALLTGGYTQLCYT